MPPVLIALSRLIAWAGAFVAAGYLGRATIIDEQALSLVWPAAGVALLWLCSGSRSTWPWDVLALGACTFVVNLTTGAPPALAGLFVATNVGQVALLLVLTRRWLPRLWGFGGTEALKRLDELGRLAAAAVIACGLAAVGGVLGIQALFGIGDVVSFLVWWGRNTAGVVVVGVAGLLLHAALVENAQRGGGLSGTVARLRPKSPGRTLEVAMMIATSAVIYATVFLLPTARPFAFLLLVPTFWAGIRFAPLAATLHSLVSGVAAISFTLLGHGPFLVLEDLSFRALVAQVFVIMTVVAGLSLAFSSSTERQVSAELGVLLTESKLREDAVAAARDRVERLFQDAPQGIAVLSTDGVLRQLNPALCEILGRSEVELIGTRLTLFCQDRDDTTVADHLREVVANGTCRAEATWSCRPLGGGARAVSLSSTLLRDADGPGRDAVLMNVVDVSERERYQQQLAHLADHDPLTGLANRRKFEKTLQRHLELQRRHSLGGAVLMLDLDHFKDVNDTLGHSVGDQLLVAIAGGLHRRLRDTDLVARLGGDEFAVLLPGADLVVAERVAGEIIDLVRRRTATLEGVQRRVTVSVGGMVLLDDDTAEEALSLTDTMLYEAKDAGRNRSAVLDRRVHAQPHGSARVMWTERIERAIELDDFELHLQPILEVATGRVTGAEALLRMRHEGELVLPSHFLPVAERTQCVVQLDRWVVRHGVALLAVLQRADPSFRLAINLSAKSVEEREVEDELRRALARHRVDPTGLVLEITETAALSHIHEARGFIDRIRPLGCRFALDDFGAGFGSFYYLKHLPFDVVKIDGEFVDGCATSPTDRAIIASVAAMASELGKETVAEFVTDRATLEVVRSLGVDHAQGYHIGEPVPVEVFLDTLSGMPLIPLPG